MSYIRRRVVPVALITLVGTGVLLVPPLLGIHAVPVPRGPDAPYALSDFAEALEISVREDGVDHAALRAGRDPLLRFVQAIATHGPKTAKEAFPTRPEQLAYYINAYNALVLYGVLVHAPKTSVHDVHGAIEPIAGFGFFWAQRFTLDGEATNLYDLENDVLRGFEDARIHAALNCASASCPPLRPRPYRPETLDEELDQQTRLWVGSNAHVDIGPDAIYLSAIFDWFAEDFIENARASAQGSEVLDWIASYLSEEKRERLELARSKNFPVRFFEYDWRLNRADTSSTAAEAAPR